MVAPRSPSERAGAGLISFGDPDQVIFEVGGEVALLRSLRALEKQNGDQIARTMKKELQKASRLASRSVVLALRAAAPVGNYRKPKRGEKRVAKKRNTRKVQIGKYAGGQQPAGELRKSIKAQNRQGFRSVIMGGDAAFYVKAVIAGHTLTHGGGVVPPDDFVWDTAPKARAEAERTYQKALEKVAKKFRAEHGRTRYTSASSGRRR